MERRAYERFQLGLPTRVEVISSGGGQVFEAQTRNISARGAFLNTQEALPEGSRVRLDLTVESERITELTGAQGLIKVEGTVVRSTPEGIAIHFDGEATILGLRTS
jgi:PilZ domain